MQMMREAAEEFQSAGGKGSRRGDGGADSDSDGAEGAVGIAPAESK